MDWKEKSAKRIKLKMPQTAVLFSKSKFSQVKSKPWNHHLCISYSSNIWMSGTCFWNPYHRIFYSFSPLHRCYDSFAVTHFSLCFVICFNSFQIRSHSKYIFICISLTRLSPFPLVMEIWIATIALYFFFQLMWFILRSNPPTYVLWKLLSITCACIYP